MPAIFRNAALITMTLFLAACGSSSQDSLVGKNINMNAIVDANEIDNNYAENEAAPSPAIQAVEQHQSSAPMNSGASDNATAAAPDAVGTDQDTGADQPPATANAQ